MTAPLRRTLLCLLVAALAILAHAPLAVSGFVGGDLELLAAVARHARGQDADPADANPSCAVGLDAIRRGGAATLGPLTWFAGGDVRPIPAAVLEQHARCEAGVSPLEPAAARPLRILALAALLVGAAGAGVTLRRVLVPWLGESAARAAGWACAGIAVAHPVTVAVVARPSALGDLLGLAAGSWCTAFFLRGRQQRRDRFLVLAALLAITAGFASSAAWFLPFACALIEYTSAHRPRAMGRKLGAAATVALVAAACVAIESACAWSQPFGYRAGTLHWDTLGDIDVVRAVSALGVLFVPAPSPAAPIAYLVVGAVLLVACEPLLRAARAAPRLWGWLVLAWLGSVALTLALARDLVVPPGQVELAGALLLPAVLVSAAFATASTALGGSRRTVMPLAIAAGLCILSDQTARLWPTATRELLALRADLGRALAAAGSAGTAFVVGAPRDPRAIEMDDFPFEQDVRSFGAPGSLDLVGGDWPPTREEVDQRLRRVRAQDLPYLVRVPTGDELRRRGLAVLLSGEPDRPVVRIPPPEPEAAPFGWSGSERSSSELLELDPIAFTAVRVVPRVGISTAEPPRMHWRSTSPLFENGTIEGAWVATDDGPQAVFDLWRSNEWLLGGTIRRISFEKELLRVVNVSVFPRIPLEGLSLADHGATFELPKALRPRAWSGEPEWFSIVVNPEWMSAQERQGRLFPDGSGDIPLDSTICNAGPAWRIVECRVDGVTVARTQPVGGPPR